MTTWAEQAAHALSEALTATIGADGVPIATAAVDAGGTAVAGLPAETAATGRFEVGSVTKTMTATVLATLASDGTVRLDGEIGHWLSAGTNGALTVGRLATHTSGLPSVPPNLHLDRADPRNPWAGYGFERAEEGLRQATVTPGNPWRYSNLGYQLLALLLQRAAGQDYATLVAERLLDPLGMTCSGVGSRGRGTLVSGHADGHPVPQWDHPLGAGGVEATIEDLARYARACLFPPPTPLGEAIALAQRPVVRIDDDTEQALGWRISGAVHEHTGGTGGFGACVAVAHPRGRAVAILAGNRGGPVQSSHFRHAARLTLTGEDPRAAELPHPWPSWQEDALSLARAFADGRIAQVHQRLAPQVREKLTPQRLERAWAAKIRPAGPATAVAVTDHDVAATGAVVATIEITFADALQRLRTVVLPTGRIAGLALLP